MSEVGVFTISAAAIRLDLRREYVSLLLARKELTPATINERPAVLDDLRFRRLARKARKVAA